MNGVIINDERIHQESWRQYCQNHGFQLTEEEFKHEVFGRTEKDVFEYLYKRPITPDELAKFSDERVDVAIDIFKPQIKLADGLQSLLEQLHEMKIPLAIATSSRRRYYQFVIDALLLSKFFQATVTAEDITHGKPHPEIYLAAAKALGVAPADCEAIEDSVSGIKSAQAAGMTVTAIASTHQPDELQSAERVIKSFTEIDASTLIEG